MLEKGSWSCTPDGVFPASCDTVSVEVIKNSASVVSENGYNSSTLDMIDNDFSTNDSILNDRGAASGSLCRFPLGDISPTGNGLDFFGNEHEQNGSSDFFYFGWPDIGNFEDVDKLFRSCDSTFGQGNVRNDEELSWFSSTSHAIEGSEDALKPNLRSSYSESSLWESTSKHHEANTKSMSDTVTSLIGNSSDEKNIYSAYRKSSQPLDKDKPIASHISYSNWFNGEEDNVESTSKQHVNKKHRGPHDNTMQEHKMNDGTKIKISPITETSDESSGMINLQRKQLKPQNSSERQREDQSSEYFGSSFHGSGITHQSADVKPPSAVPPILQVFPFPEFQQQNQNSLHPLNYLDTCIPPCSGYKNRPGFVSVTPTTSIIKSEITNYASLTLEAPCSSKYVGPMETSSDHSSKAPDMTPDKMIKEPCPLHEDLVIQAPFTGEMIGASVEATPELDSSIVQESSCLTSVSDELSLEATSFLQLQYVMEQLDIRTKLCIRDGLYRLARSAEQRRNFGKSNGCSRDDSNKCGLLKTEESDKCTGFMDMETNTNPIDRSIAHLLFHRPLSPSTAISNEAVSSDSRCVVSFH